MFLKSIELFGFKSFADRTMIEFVPGITVIVGPNGCGKSNVVDAIKWVVGEKQARNIRGQKMEDVIFSGTEQRKPVSIAEVSITVDNSEHILDIDASTVTIGRRIFRDGESEYLINKSPVRLKDVEKLFMDTGIGKTSYSVLEQGKMDLILSTRAEDRRYVFEEAAGISRFKFQKKESVKKLEETSENLKRINDIIREIEREKDLKSKQAEKTKIYITLREKFQDADIKMNILKYRELFLKVQKVSNDIEKFKKERTEISNRVSSVSVDNERDEQLKNDIQNNLWELDKQLSAFKIRLEDTDKKTEKNKKNILEQEEHKKTINIKIKERTENLRRLQEEKDKTAKSEIDIRAKIDVDKVKLKELFERRKGRISYIHESRDKIETNKNKISGCEQDLKKLRDDLEIVIRELIDAIDRRKAELQNSENERQSVKTEIKNKLRSIEENLHKAKQSLEQGVIAEAVNFLNYINLEQLKLDIDTFESFEDGFRSILFDKTGIHAKKEELDTEISKISSAIDEMRMNNSMFEESIHNAQTELEDVNSMISRIEKDLSKYENDVVWIEKHIESLNFQIKDMDMQIANHNEDIERSDNNIKTFQNEIEEWNVSLIEFNEKSNNLIASMDELTGKKIEIEKKIHERKQVSRKDEEGLNVIAEKIGNLEKLSVEFTFKKSGIEDYLWIEYEKKTENYDKLQILDGEGSDLQNQLASIKKEIQELGPINNLAIEEFKDLKKRFDYYIDQRKDIESARQDILSVIEDINKTSVEMFMNTFTEIQKNFATVFKQLFEGGDAIIELTEIENVLESGIDIIVRPPGKKTKNINLLSGGERALTAIALLFATYMVKPSPFCFLDEIDAPLDEENVGRFLRMLREFSKSTQFVMVTHSKKSMSVGECIYGVTMEEPGISKVVSIQMSTLGAV